MNPTATRTALMGNHNFQWLLRGSVISMLGDQLTMIALPWLVLKLTGDPLALGMVIALMSIPRAVFILLGGALVDRYSPQRVLMLSKYANALLLAILTLLMLTGTPGHSTTWSITPSLSLTVITSEHMMLMLIYSLAFCLGLAQAFSIPAGTSILPKAIPSEHLQAANGMLMGLRQLSMLLGPLLAAALLALEPGNKGDGASAIGDAYGLALAFGLDGLSFLLSAWTLSRVTLLTTPAPAMTGQPAAQSVLQAVGAGLKTVWDDLPMRLCFIYWGSVSLLIGGAMQVAVPMLASDLHGASTLGLLMAASGAGTLLGMGVAAKSGSGLRGLSFGSTILAADATVGLLVMVLALVNAAWQAALLMLTVGLLSGYMQINVFTWIQRRVAPHMMGRTMSIFMFIFMGLAPLSAAGAGWLLTLMPLSQLFVGGGIILLAFSMLAYLFTPMRTISAHTPQP